MTSSNQYSNDSFQSLFRHSGISRSKLEGSFIEGTIVSRDKHVVSVYTGLKMTTNFIDRELLSIKKRVRYATDTSLDGQKIQLLLNTIENIDGEMVLNPQYYGQRTKAISAWERTCKLKYAKGIVLNSVNSGFSVGIGGMVSFLPRSRAKLPKTGKKEYIQSLMDNYCLYKIIKVNHVRKNIVVSLVSIPTTSDIKTSI